jgi:molybdopterin-guanine dinucleotide biosynthesis protein A
MSDDLRTAISAVILAGGRAERMGGQDKGLLDLAGQPLVAHIIRALRPQVGELLINANRNAAAYAAFACPVVSDSVPGYCGPLAGMLAALDYATQPFLLSVPCDSPLLPADLAARLYAALHDVQADLSVAWDGVRLQPVFVLLRRTLRDDLRACLMAGERKIDRWFARHRLARADFSDCPVLFRNLNTPAELAALAAELTASAIPVHTGISVGAMPSRQSP